MGSEPMHESGAPTRPVERPRRRLRNFLLRPSFQLRFVGYTVGITALVSVGFGGLLLGTTRSLFEQVDASVVSRQEAAQASRDLGRCVMNQELSQHLADPGFTDAIAQRSRSLDAKLEAEEAAVRSQRTELEHQKRRTFLLVLGALGALVVTLGLFSIVVTHRIVGPRYRLEQHFKVLQAGSLATPLGGPRPGDELQELFTGLYGLVDVLRRQASADLARVEEARRGDAGALDALKAELEARLAPPPSR